MPEGEVIFTTTSLSQFSNWSHLFNKTSRVEAASGVVKKATIFSPITTHRQGQLRKKYGDDFLSDASEWRENLQTLRALGEPFRDGAQDDQNLISIVDEAHALINPEHPEGRGQFGFATTLGPQAYHIIRSSVVTVFLVDPLQSFRERENTRIEDIQRWSRELGAGNPEEISLEGNQFRCAGSAEFVSWIEGVLKGDKNNIDDNRALARQWIMPPPANGDFPAVHEGPIPYGGLQKLSAKADFPSRGLDFRIFENPETWESELRRCHKEGYSVRILSSYCREWKTEKAADPHSLQPRLMDFHEPYEVANQTRYWSRVWNFIPSNGNDYTWYVSGHPASRIAEDPLCEVGCPYAVRGFDYDYVGILWLDDLVWDGQKVRVNPFAVEERGVLGLIRAARKEAENKQIGQRTLDLLERVSQAYRILFTRALKGIYVWVPDTATRGYLLESFGSGAAYSPVIAEQSRF